MDIAVLATVALWTVVVFTGLVVFVGTIVALVELADSTGTYKPKLYWAVGVSLVVGALALSVALS